VECKECRANAPTINSVASDEVWLLKSCQCWSTSRVGHVEDFEFAQAAYAVARARYAGHPVT